MVNAPHCRGAGKAGFTSHFEGWEEEESQIPPVEENSVFGLQASEVATYLRQDVSEQGVQASLIQAMCKFLRARDRVFGHMLYSDPSWEIILLLHAARTEGKQISFTDLCRVLDASSETLMRCVALLEGNGLVVKQGTQPATMLDLSGNALEMIDQTFKLTPPRSQTVWQNEPLAS